LGKGRKGSRYAVYLPELWGKRKALRDVFQSWGKVRSILRKAEMKIRKDVRIDFKKP